jgi:microcompartment protein CcmL/EutN
MIEFTSVPKGIEAGDAMMKAADVGLAAAHPVCAGKYIVVVTGDVAAVKASVAAGLDIGGIKIVDKMIIPDIDPQVPLAINMCNGFNEVKAVGAFEMFSLCACVFAADAAVKAAEVRLIEVRLARGLGGKGYITLTGETSAVESALRAVKALDEVQGLMSECVVIPSPHPDIVNVLL